jgi:hypothetical protein
MLKSRSCLGLCSAGQMLLIIWTFTFFGCCDLLLARTAHSGKNRFGHLVLGTPSAIPAGRMAWERETGAQRCRVCRVPGQYGGGTPAASAARFNCTQVPAKPELFGGRNLPRPQRGAGWANGGPGGRGPGGGDRGSAPPRARSKTHGRLIMRRLPDRLGRRSSGHEPGPDNRGIEVREATGWLASERLAG